ncbi:MFS transporter [Shewanella salipaludis]|uniref:MFS transporter n=1 Tax=Shewanella salipaludis TaxID=2723052 RepID=A0A972FZP2_9GAMM|nr:MFS transporter [Shewanella salipaludis]NMH66148.1 MFS transporter [Shewanella salipaludis]
MLLSKRFLPYFVTQCLGALNDNIYKNVLLLMVTYSQVGALPMGVDVFVNLAAGVFILPFFLFSAHAGLVADNRDKAKLIRSLKLLELVIMSCAAIAIVNHDYLQMLLLLFLMGTQSAYFGPVKYSLLPQALAEDELVGGNAWVELGTFLSILLGTLSAGFIVASERATLWSALTVVSLALIGYLASRGIPSLPPPGSAQRLTFTPLAGTWRTLKQARNTPEIWMAIFAISWFWLLGATYLTQFPNFTRLHLQAGAEVVSVLLALFSIGIALGSLLCSRLSAGQVELGLVPFGALGLSLFGGDVYWATPEPVAGQLFGLLEFVATAGHWRLMLDLLMVGVSGGLFIVPLYAFIQARAAAGECAQAIAANNIVNAFFMVCSAILSMLLLGVVGWSIPELFLALALANALVALFVYARMPEFALRFIGYLVSHLWYRVGVEGREWLPSKGTAGVMICNSRDGAAALLVLRASARKIGFVIPGSRLERAAKLDAGDAAGEERLWCASLLRRGAALVIRSSVKDEEHRALESIRQVLARGELVCLLFAGGTDASAGPDELCPGIADMLARESVPVISLSLLMAGETDTQGRGPGLAFGAKIRLNIKPGTLGAEPGR